MEIKVVYLTVCSERNRKIWITQFDSQLRFNSMCLQVVCKAIHLLKKIFISGEILFGQKKNNNNEVLIDGSDLRTESN